MTVASFETVREYADSQGLSPSVDRHQGIIRGVKILGLESKNGRSYTPECVAKAKPLYEGAKVNVNHPAGRSPRSYQDRIGVIREVAIRQDGLYADFHFNPRHALSEQLCWDAEHAPSNVGFSHVVSARITRKDGRATVEAIDSVESVDLVADPATTGGLFESEELPTEPAQRELCEHGLSAVSDARSILLGEGEIETKKTRLLEVLAVWQAELAGHKPGHKENEMEWKEITAESLKEHRADLVEVLTGTDKTSTLEKELQEAKSALETANTKLAEAAEAEARAAKEKAIAEGLKASL